jgi:hypothetical protein
MVAQSYYRSRLVPSDRWGLELFDMAEGGETYSLAQTYPDIAADMQKKIAAGAARFAPYKKGPPPGRG